MSYHDKLLTQVRGKGTVRMKTGAGKSMLRGIREITLRPNSPHVKLGTLYDDVNAVSRDLRKALEDIRASD